jgi:hypothetical protein
MSTVKSKKLQVGTDASASNNFTIYQPATPDGTLRIGVGNADSPTEVGRFTSAGMTAKNPYSCRVETSTTTSASNNTTTTVILNNVIFDDNNDFNTSTYTYTVPVAGVYLFSAAADINSSSAQCRQGTRLYVNSQSYWAMTGTNGANNNVINTQVIKVDAGDTVTVAIYHDSGATRTVTANTKNTFFSATLLHTI